jgi:hypothetical protein
MARYFTHYWTNKIWIEMAELLSKYVWGKLTRAGSNQFENKKIMPGDHVYVVTIFDGKLIFGGKIVVDKVLGQNEAQKYENWGYKIWEADKHVTMPLSQAGYFTPENIIPISVVRRLEFISGSSVRKLTFVDDQRLDVQTLRNVRELEPSSARLLDEYLESFGLINEKTTDRNVSLPEGSGSWLITLYVRETLLSPIYLNECGCLMLGN